MATCPVPIVRLDDQPAEAAAAALCAACADQGFVVLAGHGVPEAVVAAQRAASRCFFGLPLHDKMTVVSTAEDHFNRGYSPANEQKLDPAAAHPDTKEGFYIGRELTAGMPLLPLRGPNRWPAEELCPGFRGAMLAYHAAMVQLSDRLLELLATGLGLPPGWFADKFDQSLATLRPLHYSALDGREGSDGRPAAFGAGAHTDFGCLTLLLTDEQPGLQLFLGGAWVDVPPAPDCLIMNVGDLLERWTNGRFKATLHRVVNCGRERFSTAFFLDANMDAVVECLPTCCGPDRPAKYTPITAGAHLYQRLQASNPPRVEAVAASG